MVEGKDILNFLIVILLFLKKKTLKERNIIFIFKFINFF